MRALKTRPILRRVSYIISAFATEKFTVFGIQYIFSMSHVSTSSTFQKLINVLGQIVSTMMPFANKYA